MTDSRNERLDPLGQLLFSHLRELPDGSLTRAEVGVLLNYIERLEARLTGHLTPSGGPDE